MEKTTFGEHLRREREMRGVSLAEISTATRIGVRFLEALENEQWDRLPGGVFNRGFIRAVARFLGLDEENLVSEYALLTHDTAEKAVWNTAASAGNSGGERTSRHVLLWGLAALVVLLSAGGAWAWREYGSTLRTWREPVPELPPAQTPAAPAVAAPEAGANPAPANSASAADAEMLELKVEATQATEVTVAADGKTVFDGRMKPGGAQQFKAKDRFDVSARNSTALLMDLNGQTLAPPGRPGAPGKITLTRKDLKKP
jgi:cytoskeleton protein RodZ